MRDRFVEIARDPATLRVRNGCLVIQRDGMSDVVVALFELSAVVLAHPRCSITQPAISALMDAGVPLLCCDSTHLPIGMMLPMHANTLQTQRMLAQVAAPKPLQKRLWKQVVRAKLLAQAAALEGLHADDGGLRELAATVRSGDPENVEGTGAQRYWPLLFRDPDFRRRFEAQDQNRFLNYGYAIIRAAVGRAICATGLHPSIGIHHRGRENPYCLADDLMEPYRPLVDAEVVKIAGEFGKECPFDAPTKRRLLELLDLRLRVSKAESTDRTVTECIARTCQSVAECFMRSARSEEFSPRVFYPYGLQHW